MIPDLSPGYLTWAEVDPARHPFDSAAADEVVRSLGPARHDRVPSRPDVSVVSRELASWRFEKARPWTDAMSHALAEHYGRWALGWRWSTGEGDYDGGPVGHWCCSSHSVTTPEETIARVVAALCEWREWLETLSRWFDAYPLDPNSIDEQRILWDRAVHNVILQVVDRTGCESGWYGHCIVVLTWFLTRWGVAQDAADELVVQAIGGRFQSWTGPDAVLVDDVAEKIASSARPGGMPDSGPIPDHLEHWLSIRTSARWQDRPNLAAGYTGAPIGAEPPTPARDGAAEDIRFFDGALDPARAQGLLAALELARTDAARGAVLDFEMLRRWQQHILGTQEPPPFRTQPAFAKRGAERYGIAADTRARLDDCLAESGAGDEETSPLAVRAARACLDVCFFHPFDDGNARAAFLALVFVLAREGVTLDNVGLLRRISFAADDPQAPLVLAGYIGIHRGQWSRQATDSR